MPSWTPQWTDVRFDHAAAERAALACERAVRVLAAAGAERDRLVRLALATGRGPRLEALGRRNVGMAAADQAVGIQLRVLAAVLRSSSTAARVDQAGREAGRARWHAESDAEARLLQAAAAGRRPPG